MLGVFKDMGLYVRAVLMPCKLCLRVASKQA